MGKAEKSGRSSFKAGRFLRERKNYRLTKLTISKLEALSSFYQTTETAIVEAGVQMLHDCYNLDRLGDAIENSPVSPSAFGSDSADDGQSDLAA